MTPRLAADTLCGPGLCSMYPSLDNITSVTEQRVMSANSAVQCCDAAVMLLLELSYGVRTPVPRCSSGPPPEERAFSAVSGPISEHPLHQPLHPHPKTALTEEPLRPCCSRCRTE